MRETLNSIIVKGIDYGTEEYVKTLLSNSRSDRKLQAINPYVGVISYPSDDFLLSNLTYKKAVQFQNTTYVGHMEFLLPPKLALSNTGLSYTLLSYELDGKARKFLQVSGGFSTSQAVKFADFILGQFPDVNLDFAFNRHAFHVLSDIEISGATYVAQDEGAPFVLVTSGAGAFTPSIVFEFAVSGFKCLLQ